MSEKRDIAAEIDMRCKAVEAIMQVRTTGKGYPTILDEVLEIVGYESLITRTAELEAELDLNTKLLAGVAKERDHALRMVDGAVEAMAHRNCLYVDVLEAPIPDKPCAYWKTTPHTEESCRKCVRDYLDQKVKEAATHA